MTLDSEKIVFGVIKGRECEYINMIRGREKIIILKTTDDNIEEVREAATRILKKWDVQFLITDKSVHTST